MVSTLQSRVLRARQQLQTLDSRPVLKRPEEIVEQRARIVDEWEQRLSRAMQDVIQRGKEKVAVAAAGLNALSPLSVLERGYSVTQDQDGQVLVDIQQLQIGQEMVSRLFNGRVISVVQSTEQIETKLPDQ